MVECSKRKKYEDQKSEDGGVGTEDDEIADISLPDDTASEASD